MTMSATGYKKKSLGLNPDLDVHMTQNHGEESKWMEFWTFMKEYFDLDKKKSDLLQFIQENPLKSTIIIITLAMCAIPVSLFVMFVVGSILFTLMGFLIFEGSILAIGVIVLGFTVLIAGSIGIFLSISLVGGYKGFQMSSQVWKQARDMLLSLPFIGNLFSPSSTSKTD